MTSANAPNNTAPEPRKRPDYTMRVLVVVNGPALTATPVATPAAAVEQTTPRRTGQGWYVTRERWAVEL